jgi:hypothetical protein
VYQANGLAMILSALSPRRSEKADIVHAGVTALPREVTRRQAQAALSVIEDGKTEMDDILEDRLNSLKADRYHAKAALERAKSHSSQAIEIDPALLEGFGRSMRENLSLDSLPQGLSAIPHRRDRGRRHPNPYQRQERRARKSCPGQPEWGHSGFANEY